MLRITVEPEGDVVRLRLEGDLAGAWVHDLEEAWRATRARFAGKVTLADLSEVSRVDDAGRYLMALIHEAGTRLTSTGLETRALLESIARDWPAPAAGARGRADDAGQPPAYRCRKARPRWRRR